MRFRGRGRVRVRVRVGSESAPRSIADRGASEVAETESRARLRLAAAGAVDLGPVGAAPARPDRVQLAQVRLRGQLEEVVHHVEACAPRYWG